MLQTNHKSHRPDDFPKLELSSFISDCYKAYTFIHLCNVSQTSPCVSCYSRNDNVFKRVRSYYKPVIGLAAGTAVRAAAKEN